MDELKNEEEDLKREKEEGLTEEYMLKAFKEKEKLKGKYLTPWFCLMSQLFSSVAKAVIEELGPEKGEEILKRGIESFGYERGRRIAERVKVLGKPLSFKNWVIYSDIEAELELRMKLEDGDVIFNVLQCGFHSGGADWDLMKYAYLYCKYVDNKIIEGYNPDIKLKIDQRLTDGSEYCIFRYITKDKNKKKL